MEKIRPGLDRLTRKPDASTLRSDRRFMAEHGEIQPQGKSKIATEVPDSAREAYAKERGLDWNKLDIGVRAAIDNHIRETGAKPGPGAMSSPEGKIEESEKTALGEVITDPHLKPFATRAEKIIDEIKTGRLDKDKIEDLYKEIMDLGYPEEYDSDIADHSKDEARLRKRDLFSLQKQMIRNAIGSALLTTRASSPERDEEAHRKVENLARAVGDENYGEIENIINDIDIGDHAYAEVIKIVVEKSGGKEYVLEMLLEYGVERILNPADSSPKGQYPRLNLYQEQNLDSIIQIARRFDEAKGRSQKRSMFRYLSELREKRYIMHELFRSMKDKQSYTGIVTQHLRKEGFAFVEKQMVGVADIQQIYEEVLGSNLSLKKGWLTDGDFERADDEVMDEFAKAAKRGELERDYKNDKGDIEYSRPLRDWEISRAFHMGRSLSAGTLRRVTYGVMGDISKGDEGIKSLEFEFMARVLAPFKLIPSRFFSQGISQRFIELFVKNLKKGEDGKENKHKYGYVAQDKNGKVVKNKEGEPDEKGFYGKEQESMAILDLGIPDMKSHSWRSRYIFLRQKSYQTETIGDDKFSIGEYLDKQKEKAKEDAKEQFGGKEPKEADYKKYHEYEEEWRKIFNEKISAAIKDQRLFLGVLMRYDDLDDFNKQQIWENVAQLLPSRIASLIREEALEIVSSMYGIEKNEDGSIPKEAIEKWKKVRSKIWRAERLRVKEDAEILRRGDGTKPKKTLADYFAQVELSPQEIDIVESLQKLGSNHIVTDEKGNRSRLGKNGDKAKGGLVKSTFAFTVFLDDVPQTEWENLTDEDADRLLVRDYENYDKGYGHFVGLIANPAIRPQEVIKKLHEGFEQIASPFGIHTAQKRIKPVISTYLQMSRLNDFGTWFSAAMKLSRSPRSEMEKYNLQSKIANDEEQRAKFLEGCAQLEMVSDDSTEKDKNGKTQLIKMKEENDADKKHVILGLIRLIFLLFGPVAGKEFLKLILPGDLAKSLG